MNKPILVVKDAQPGTSGAVAIVGFFLVVWVYMLVLGALGHQLHIVQLQHISYWTTALFYIVAGMFRGKGGTTKWGVFDK